MQQVQPSLRQAYERYVARHHELLGLRRHTGNTQAARPLTLVHCRARRESAVLAVLGQSDPEPTRVLQRAPHDTGVLHACTVVGEEPNPEVRELPHRGEMFAGASNRDRPCHRDLADGAGSERQHFRRDRCIVERGIRVRHGHDRREPPERRGTRAGVDALGVFVPRLAQVDVQVDQPWHHQATPGI
jgi:hypothetical protein